MATIMTMGNSEGTRRCDATCHNAKGPQCDCICAGRYHGKGNSAQTDLQTDLENGAWGESLKNLATIAGRAVEIGEGQARLEGTAVR